MRNKVTLSILILFLLAVGVLFAEGQQSPAKPAGWTKDTTFLDLFGIGLLKPTFNNQGQIVSLQGFNILLGYRWKNYFESLRIREVSLFWDVGFVFLIPYVGVGLDYPLDEKIYLGAGVMVTPFIIFLVPPTPYVTIGFTF